VTLNEADTRAELIDPKLKQAGWGEVAESRVQREYNINAGEIRSGGIRTGQMKADYVLAYKNRKLAVVEAKSVELEVSEGVAQAKLYASKLELAYTYATNGKEIYEMCLSTGEEKLIDSFPTPDELWYRTFGDANEWQTRFNAVPFEDVNGTKQARYYQEIAVNKVMEAVANNAQRILLTLATGTGKTFVAYHDFAPYFAASYNLKAKFLVDLPEGNPSPNDVKRVMDTVKASNLKTLLTEPQSGKDAFAGLAKDLNVRVSTFDPMETGGNEALQPDYYITTMRKNVKTLVTAFTGQSTQSFVPIQTLQPVAVVPQQVWVRF
jgi:hypothetical protein